MILDICYGGCGGIWFDAQELERVNARAATSLHTIWQTTANPARRNENRKCARCQDKILDRKWFSQLKKVEIDQCPACAGIFLDAGDFSRIHEEVQGAKVAPPGWVAAMAEAAMAVSHEARSAQ